MKINNSINTICILRLSAIGDVTHVLPVIATLKKNLPNAKITWVIGILEHKLMQGIKGVNFVVFDKKGGSTAYKKLKNMLKDTTFDVLFHMQYSFRANRAAWQIKAKQRIGFDKKRSRELHGLRLTHRIKAVEKQHVLDGFMEFLHVIGIEKFVYQWKIITSVSDIEYADNLIVKDKPNIVISPFSSNKTRNWSNENYAKIIDFLTENYSANVILCGSPSPYEIENSQIIERLTEHDVINTTGKDTLKQLFALMQKVDLVISPDSGPMHIANAAQTAVIGLHGATTAKRSGAYSYPHLAIDCFEHAAEKIVKKSSDEIRWGKQININGVMDLITVPMVIEKIEKVLSN